jgi:HEPN domain-containing protein
MSLVESYIKNADLAIKAARTLLASQHPDMCIPAAGHIGRAVENYLKAYLEFLGGDAGHSHNLGQLVAQIRGYADNHLGKIGSSDILRELMPFITGSSYAFTASLPPIDVRTVERYLKYASDLRGSIIKAVE